MITESPPQFQLSSFGRTCVTVSATAAVVERSIGAATAWARGEDALLVAFGFTVLFPLLLVVALMAPASTRSREGALMRLGAALHLVLVIAAPAFALQLLLGLPVVFLLVELFETRLPGGLREPIARRLVRC